MTESMLVECSMPAFAATSRRAEVPAAAVGRIPRLSRLLALALRMDQLVRSGAVRSYKELAKLGHVSPARVSQIMNLLLLAPDIQEEILFLPRLERGREPLRMRQVLPITMVLCWDTQRARWQALSRDLT